MLVEMQKCSRLFGPQTDVRSVEQRGSGRGSGRGHVVEVGLIGGLVGEARVAVSANMSETSSRPAFSV